MFTYILRKYRQHSILINNFIWRSIQILGKSGVTFFIFFISAKLLPPFEFGVYNYLITLIMLLVIFGDFGISSACTKYIAEFNVLDNQKVKQLPFNASILIISLATIISILTVTIGRAYLIDKFQYVIYLIPMLFFVPLTSLYDGIYRGLKKFKELSILFLSVGTFSIVLSLILILKFGLIGALLGKTILYGILSLSLIVSYKNYSFRLSFPIIKTILSYSIILGISSLGYYLYNGIDIIILGHFGFIESINSFKLFNTALNITVLAFSIFGQIIAPDITHLYAKQKYRVVITKFEKYLKLSLLLSLPLFISFLFIFPIVVKILLPHLYNTEAITIFRILSFTVVSVLVNAVLSNFIVATGNIKLGLLTIPFGLLNLSLNLIFIKLFGAIGVAYSTLLTVNLINITSSILLYLNLKKKI
jgi:O-antigen/teichoic acid export membrane protein